MLPTTDVHVDLPDIWGACGDDVWVVGVGADADRIQSHAVAFHFDGAAWTADTTPAEAWNFMHVSGTRDSMWVMDQNERVYRRAR